MFDWIIDSYLYGAFEFAKSYRKFTKSFFFLSYASNLVRFFFKYSLNIFFKYNKFHFFYLDMKIK